MSAWFSNISALTLVYIGALALSCMVVGGFLYISYQNNGYTESKASIEADIQGLTDIYELYGSTDILIKVLQKRLENQKINFFYMIFDSDGKKIGGNIREIPTTIEERDGEYVLYELPYENVLGKTPEVQDWYYPHYDVLTKKVVFSGADNAQHVTLLIGRDLDAFQTSQAIISSLAWSAVLLTSLMAFIGFTLAYVVFHRVRLLQQVVTKVIDTGDLSLRIPETEATGDFKLLASRFNEMWSRIEESMMAVRQVSDNIAHDLRTPITRLQHHVEILRAANPRINMEDVSKEVDHIINIFNSLLRIANIEQGKRSVGFAPIDLNKLLNDLYEYYDPLIKKKMLIFQKEIPHCTPTVIGDKDLLFQAFSNIMENAIKFTPKGGLIMLSMIQSDENVKIIISDTGPGLGDEDKPKIFRRFFRAESSRQTPGYGLGLSLVKAVADLHKASIFVEDNSPSGLRMAILLKIVLPV